MKLDRLEVEVTFRVGLGELNLPKEEFEQLTKAFEKGKELDGFGYDEFNEAREWLSDNIKQGDCCDISYEITDMY